MMFKEITNLLYPPDNPCKLFCSDVDDTIIANWGSTVLDGTPCTLGTNNMCIDGICKVGYPQSHVRYN